MKPHRGTLVLIFGILGLVTCFGFGIAAWIMGNNDLKEMDAGLMDPAGRGSTQAGKVCGMIAVILNALLLVVGIGFVLLVVLFGASSQTFHI